MKKEVEEDISRFIDHLEFLSDVISLHLIEDRRHDCEFNLFWDFQNEVFYFTLVGDNEKAKKRLLKKAFKELRSSYFKKDKLTLDDIYDIKTLASAPTLPELCKKMKLILKGC